MLEQKQVTGKTTHLCAESLTSLNNPDLMLDKSPLKEQHNIYEGRLIQNKVSKPTSGIRDTGYSVHVVPKTVRNPSVMIGRSRRWVVNGKETSDLA